MRVSGALIKITFSFFVPFLLMPLHGYSQDSGIINYEVSNPGDQGGKSNLQLLFQEDLIMTKLLLGSGSEVKGSSYYMHDSSDVINFRNPTSTKISKSAKSRFQAFSLKPTGKSKEILGFISKEYELISVNQIKIATLFISDELPKNLAPSMPVFSHGTVLESIKRNGTHYLAKEITFQDHTEADLSGFNQFKSDFHILESEGKKFPAFKFKSLDGVDYSSSDLLGKVVVLNFWFTGCAPCIAELPDVNALHDKYKAYDEVVFLSITWNDEAAVKKFLDKREFVYTHIYDVQWFIDQIGLSQYPTHVVIDKKGMVKVSAATPLNPMILKRITDNIDAEINR